MSTSEKIDIAQGTDEWKNLRKTKITATDASIILGVNPWKTIDELYLEKKSDYEIEIKSCMQRGIDLEPIARELFCMQTGLDMQPAVYVKDWAMASLDGINSKNEILEIKCPGKKDQNSASMGKVPKHYYPQLQHQMFVCDSQKVYYFSFDGLAGVILEIERDEDYIKNMIEKEFEFYQCLINNSPPVKIE